HGGGRSATGSRRRPAGQPILKGGMKHKGDCGAVELLLYRSRDQGDPRAIQPGHRAGGDRHRRVLLFNPARPQEKLTAAATPGEDYLEGKVSADSCGAWL